jgi:SAM-dependent methyltransferase
MHPTAMENAELFFKCYSSSFEKTAHVVEIGSQDVNGSIRSVCPSQFKYTGVDFCAARGVDIVLEDPYSLPFEDESIDIIISSSCFEHSEFFWVVFIEIMRCLKKNGLFYLNAPSTGSFHRYPVDCWRFYPDSGGALVKWGKRNGLSPALLESYTQIGGNWEDYVAVFIKDENFAGNYPSRIIDTKTDFENCKVLGEENFRNLSPMTQYEKRAMAISGIIDGTIKVR